jgi:hypothetical protein
MSVVCWVVPAPPAHSGILGCRFGLGFTTSSLDVCCLLGTFAAWVVHALSALARILECFVVLDLRAMGEMGVYCEGV